MSDELKEVLIEILDRAKVYTKEGAKQDLEDCLVLILSILERPTLEVN